MVLMNLFAGQEYRLRHTEQTYGHSQGGREWGRVPLKHTICKTNEVK